MNTNIQLAQRFLANRTGRVGLILQKYAPEIMLGAGLTGVIVATVMACKASTKASEALNESKEEIETVKKAKDTLSADRYSEQDYQKDLVISYVHAGTRLVKLYGPSLSLGVAGIVCILGSHGIMKRRQVAIVAAYNLVSESFNLYRKRVSEEFGEAKEYSLRHGTREESVEYVDTETGKKKKTKTQVITDKTHPSDYARFFDEMSTYWQRDATANKFFLSMKQNWLNDLLKARGHVFLNEVYDELGLPRSQAGQFVGWVIDGKGDGFIDFGIYNRGNEDFVNMYERSVLLDFNVDGVVYDKI